MPSGRLNKVAEAIKEEVAQILQQEIKDPRIGFITITRVRITADLQHATVYFSRLPGRDCAAGTEAGLKSAGGYVRRLLGERLRLRVTPEVHFLLDPSVEEGIRLAGLFNEMKKSDEGRQENEG